MNQEVRILLTGGGTGGHIYPLLAVSRHLIGIKLRYFGSPGRYRGLLKSRGIAISKIVSSKIRRYFSPLNFLDFFKFFFGLTQSLWKIYWFMPDAAFSKGGPGSLPVVLACRFYFIPVLVHESDAVPGLSNRLAARFAKKIDLAFEAATPFFKKSLIEVVGQPVRQEILQDDSRESAVKMFRMDSNQPIILILGGSQGSERINDFVLSNLQILLDKFQILHQVGEDKFSEYKNAYDFISKDWSMALKQRYFFAAHFENELSTAYNACDLVVSRAGAGSIFEIASKGRPAILIPYPEAAGDHQRANAFEAQKAGTAVMMEEQNLLPSLFITVVAGILEDGEKISRMVSAARKFYKPDAGERIAKDILKFKI